MMKRACPECEGTGWKPIEIDGIRRVERCRCQEAKITERLMTQAAIPPRYDDCNFENFYTRENPSLSLAKVQAEGFVKEYRPNVGPGSEPSQVGLLFVGPTGVGKTHLAVAVLRGLMSLKGVECLFYDFRGLLKEIQDGWNPVSQTSELRVLQPVLDVEVLLLDEMAAANPTDWVKDTLAYIINSRYSNKKVTLITTTIPRQAEAGRREAVKQPSGDEVPSLDPTLERLGSTLVSRLYEMCKMVTMQSTDYRKDTKQAGYESHAE
jgi:DNA replication protein DnaC